MTEEPTTEGLVEDFLEEFRRGDVPDEVFDGEIFNTRRIVVAPILIFLGLVVEIVAIMWHPKASETDNQ